MREFVAILLAFAVVMFAIGYMNTTDILRCVERGNTYEQCNRTFNR